MIDERSIASLIGMIVEFVYHFTDRAETRLYFLRPVLPDKPEA